ncbi:MAG: sodium:proton antiporter [Lachnospiraceae bacterium]|nr:sodium:proton antiporter [Lachnospiraceae bacterium]
MTNLLNYIVLLLSLIVLIGYFNEKISKLTYEIALMIYASVIGAVLAFIAAAFRDTTVSELLYEIRVFDLEDFLMKGVLCFMLFAGSCHMKLRDFKRLMRPVGVLAVLATFLGAVFYGLLFFAVSSLLGHSFSLPMCLMFGSIVAPTDPIAATSILNKFGLPGDISFVIEGESLLNDGVGVALFVCFSGMVTKEAEGGFFTVLFREILGAVVIGVVVTVILFQLFSRTKDSRRKIFISLLSVSLAYFLCEKLECSGAIASVVCGVLYANLIEKEKEKGEIPELSEFEGFWEILDNLLNSILYVILGFSFVRILQMPNVILLSVFAILCNLLARSGSLFFSTFLIGPLPDNYDRKSFVKLLTWGGLRGGLSIALAMSTNSMLPDEIYHIVLGCTYAIVFFTTVVQGLTMRKVYDKIKKT